MSVEPVVIQPNLIRVGPLSLTWFVDGDDPGVGGISVVLDDPDDGYAGSEGRACWAQFPSDESTGLRYPIFEAIKDALEAWHKQPL